MSSKAFHHSRVDSTTSDSRPLKRRQNSQGSNSQSSRSRDSGSPKRRSIFKNKRPNIRQRSISSASSNGSASRRVGRGGQNPGFNRDVRRRDFQNGDNFRRGRGDGRPFQQRNQGRFQNNRPYDNQRFNNRFDNRNGRNFQRRDNPMNRSFSDRNTTNRNWNQNSDRRFPNQRTQPASNWNRSQGNFDRRPQDRFQNRPTTGERYWKQSTSSERPSESRMPSRNTDSSSRSRDVRRSRDSHSYEEKIRTERSKSPVELSPEPKPIERERLIEPEIEKILHEKPFSMEKKKKKKRSHSSSSSSSSASSSDSDSDSSDSDDSSDDSSSSSSSSSSDEEKKKKKKKKLAKKLKKKEKKKRKKKKKKLKKKLAKKMKAPTIEEKKFNKLEIEQDRLLDDLQLEQSMRAKAMAPMSKKDWEKRQNVVRRVYHEESGRHRLIKGDGEVIEEIVSRERHRQINNQATRSDGDYFQSQLIRKK